MSIPTFLAGFGFVRPTWLWGLAALPLLAMGNLASAQSGLTCDDIEFTYEITSRYPDAKNACLGVVEVDGERFAKMSVELVRRHP